MAKAVYEPGSMQNFKVLLKNADNSKSVDITYLVDLMSITEDIFKNTLYGSVKIKDSIDLLGGTATATNPKPFQIIGEEFLEITYTVKNNPSVNLRFAVYKISDLIYHENNTKKEYVLHFCSEEHLIDCVSMVQKGYNQAHSDNAKSILTEYLQIDKTTPAGKRIKPIANLEPTKGLQRVVIPRLPPLQALQFLARRSISEQNFNSGTYLFFENFNGFNFCDIEYLIKIGMEKIKAGKGLYTYYYEQPITANPTNDNVDRQFKTILNINHISFFDTIQKLKMGMFESDVVVYDFINHVATPSRFRFLNNPSKDNNTSLTLGNASGTSFPENSITFMNSITSTDDKQIKYNKTFFVPKDLSSTQQDTYLDTIYPARASYFTRLAQNMFTINTYGDTNIKAGDVIILNIPAGDGNNASAVNKYTSGYYLVATINHTFTQTTYLTKMDIYKNAFGTKVNTTTEATNTKITPTNNDSLANDFQPAFEPSSPNDQASLSSNIPAFLRNLL